MRCTAQGKALPSYVRQEFEDYLKGGRLEPGFLRVRCDTSHAEHLVVFSCKRRGFCLSCGARRMGASSCSILPLIFGERAFILLILTRPIFEWMDVIRCKGIVYVGLDALTDTTVASAVGNSMFADMVSVVGHIYKHGVSGESTDTPPTISMHADEFNELIGDEFIPLLNNDKGVSTLN